MKSMMTCVKNHGGQMTMEMMLISVIIVGIAISITRYAQSNALMAGLVEGPWQPLQGMIEDGVWAKPATSKTLNPNLILRHVTPDGDKVTTP